MNKALILLLALGLLAGCAGKPRQGGPAPVENALNPKVKTAPPPQTPAVDVYAYRAPNTAPPPAPAPEAAEYAPAPLTPPVAEGPGSPGGRGPATLPPDTDPGLASAITWTPPASPASAPRTTPAPASTSVPAPTSGPATTRTQTQAQSQTSASPSTANPPPARSGTPSAAQSTTAAAGSGPVPTTGTSAPTTLASLAPPAAPKPPPPPPEVRYTAPPPPAPELPAAAASLAAQAEKQRQQGDYVAAAATLERAIRIQPREAYLWNRLARVRLDQKNYTQASSLAQKSNALSKDQAQIKEDNWGMIAATRRATGDTKGAEDAEAKAGGR